MKKKIILVLLVVLALTPALFAGGGSQAASTAAKATLTPNGQFPLTNTRAELSVLTTVATWHNEMNNNKAAKWYEDLTNVHVTYTSINEQTMHDESNLLIASGQYPDVIMRGSFSGSEIFSYGSQGILIPLEDLYDKYGYWIKKAYDPLETLPGALIKTDGHMYSIGAINECYHCMYYERVWFNEKWLGALNLKTPTTTDEFYNVLKAFKTQDPNGNGRADEIPFIATTSFAPFNFLLSAFVYWDGDSYLSMNNGKTVFTPVTDDFREGMRYIRKLVSEGLLDPVSFTQNDDQLRALVTQDTMLVGGFPAFSFAAGTGTYADTADHRMIYYPLISPLKGPTGIQWARRLASGYGTGHAMITDHAKDPALAFRWLDGAFNDAATVVLEYGLEGDGWVKPDAGALGMNERPATRKNVVRAADNPLRDFAANLFSTNRTEAVFNGVQTDWSNPTAKYDVEVWLYVNTRDHMAAYGDESKQLPPVINFTEAENTELTRLREQIGTYMKEALVAFATGNKDIERDWDAFKADLTRMNYTRYTQIYQTAYDRQYGKK